jgi:hypothetical protein
MLRLYNLEVIVGCRWLAGPLKTTELRQGNRASGSFSMDWRIRRIVNRPPLIKILQIRGNLLREPLSEALGEGLFELRGDQVRIFYTFRPGRRIVLLDGLIKKRGKVPPAILRRMRAMQKQIT